MSAKILTAREVGGHRSFFIDGTINELCESHEALRAERDALLLKIAEWSSASEAHYSAIAAGCPTNEKALRWDSACRGLRDLVHPASIPTGATP